MPSDFLSFYSPKSEAPAVLSDFIVILSFRSGYLLCRWTEILKVLCFSVAFCHQSKVPVMLWTTVTLSGPKYLLGFRTTVNQWGPKYLL
jgi:hypothetical protein